MIELITYISILYCGSNLECRYHIKDCMMDGEQFSWCKQDYQEDNYIQGE